MGACDMAAEDGLNDLTSDVFGDTSTSWARPMIENLSERRIISGYSDGTFRPNRELTRAEMAALLDGSFSDCRSQRPSQSFPDVPSSHWASSAIDRVYRC
ncbi:MAG: S-layer homology domain-containing protein, partial [Myxococcota bacterium]